MTRHGFTDRTMFQDGSPESFRPVVIVLEIVRRGARSIYVREPGTGVTASLPLSQVAVEPATRGPHRITLPTWLAQDRGLRTEPPKDLGRLF